MSIWLDIGIQIFGILARAVVTVAIPYAISLMAQKFGNDRNMKYFALAEKAITDSVTKINQTFVEGLKAEGKFDVEKQAEAFALCKDDIVKALGNDVKVALVNLVGDIDVWLDTEIEAAVVAAKE